MRDLSWNLTELSLGPLPLGVSDLLQQSRARAWHMQVLHRRELGYPSGHDAVLGLGEGGLDSLGSKDRGHHGRLLLTCPCSSPPSLTANLLHDQGAQAIAMAVRENHTLMSLQ